MTMNNFSYRFNTIPCNTDLKLRDVTNLKRAKNEQQIKEAHTTQGQVQRSLSMKILDKFCNYTE